MKKLGEFFLYHSNDDSRPFARIWWTGRKVDTNNKALLSKLTKAYINGFRIKDGLPFFNHIPMLFTSGYVIIKRAK